MEKLIDPLNIVQIAYFVKDIEKAARHMHQLTGAGPFVIYEHIPVTDCTHRGQPSRLDHSSAYGQWGGLMVEFCQQNDDGPSAFRDMYPGNEEGLHHVALFVDDVIAETERLKQLGFAESDHYWTAEGEVEVVFIDTSQVLGHMLELYVPARPLLGFYEYVAAQAKNWDGKELFNHINRQ